MAKKPSMGRQKIKIEKIEVKNHLQVTFSKRRSGLFKKASELCTLCGVEIAIIVFSPAGKVFSFGHPNVEAIVDRFLITRSNSTTTNTNNNNNMINAPYQLVEAQRKASVRELNMQLAQILYELEAERKRGENLENMRKTNQAQYWWEGPIGKLGFEELEQLRSAMEELKRNVSDEASKMMMNNPSSIFVGNGAGVFDEYESKPGQAIVGLNNVPTGNSNFGYCHGFF